MRFMEIPSHQKGNHWENVAPLGEPPQWKEKVGIIESIDINKRTLFGYDEKKFMKKQYK